MDGRAGAAALNVAYPGGTASKPAKCAKLDGTGYNVVLEASAESQGGGVNLAAPFHNMQLELQLLGALLRSSSRP